MNYIIPVAFFYYLNISRRETSSVADICLRYVDQISLFWFSPQLPFPSTLIFLLAGFAFSPQLPSLPTLIFFWAGHGFSPQLPSPPTFIFLLAGFWFSPQLPSPHILPFLVGGFFGFPLSSLLLLLSLLLCLHLTGSCSLYSSSSLKIHTNT